ncbi:MAG: alginate export family protein [Betaproteobacteria bacterium]
MTMSRTCFCTFLMAAGLAWNCHAAGEPAMEGRTAGSDSASPPMLLKLAQNLGESITNGHLLLEVRPRYARITETVKPEVTDVWTLRTMVGWQTAPFYDVRLTAQYIYTGILGPERLNADPSQFFASRYPLLPDPAHSGVNQLFAEYTGIPATRVRVGRQILRIDDQRFISDVDFRQTPQVFDGATLVTNIVPETEIQLGEYRRKRGVLGDLGQLRLHILHAAWNPLPGHTVAAYGYWHDEANTGAQTGFANNAQRITGAHAEGGFDLAMAGEGWHWMYYLAYARQNAIADGDARIRADYWRLGGGVAAPWGGVRIDHEVKGSATGVYGFQTPLTDYYAFNGWALQYTTTPPQGLRDTWISARGHVDKLEGFFEVHRFRSDFGGLALGREVDVGAIYTLLRNLQVKLQHARFTAGSGARSKNDVEKTWLAFTYIY